MRYWLLGLGGILLLAASLAAAATGLYGLMLTGSCASGGPYVSARPCPDGTGLKIVMLVVGVFTALIGLAMFVARGAGGISAATSTGGVAMASWCLGFTGLAAAFLYAGFGPESSDPSTGFKVFNGLMGGFFLLFVLPVLFTRRRRRH